ncbi:Transposase [Caloramator australicus RC3]|uniref:Transposase n=1 Tax=Caloramator australicus RC3 TaxID=857293 RepID=I7LHF1_9CLOT|nr:Transposase [Caloramator australicus RC3]
MLKAYKYRIYPTKEQEEYFAKVFGCVRFIYNKMLHDKIEYYKKTGEMLNNTPAQYKKEYSFLKEVDSLALSNAQLNLEKAYKKFFRDKKTAFPKLKTKIKIKQHRQFEGRIKSVTISKTPTGKYYASILVEEEIKELPKIDKKVGIDLGIKEFAILSDGTKVENPKWLRKTEKRIKIIQKSLSRKQKQSKNYERTRQKLAKIIRKNIKSKKRFSSQIIF